MMTFFLKCWFVQVLVCSGSVFSVLCVQNSWKNLTFCGHFITFSLDLILAPFHLFQFQCLSFSLGSSTFSSLFSFMFLSFHFFVHREISCRRLSLSDGSLSLAGPASLSCGSAPGLLLLKTGPAGQSQATVALGCPLPLPFPEDERGLEEEVHLPTTGTSEDQGGGGAGMNASSTSSKPPPQPKKKRLSTSESFSPVWTPSEAELNGRCWDPPSSTS